MPELASAIWSESVIGGVRYWRFHCIPAYGVYISQLVQVGRICEKYDAFVDDDYVQAHPTGILLH